jgi:hypothetical protein
MFDCFDHIMRPPPLLFLRSRRLTVLISSLQYLHSTTRTYVQLSCHNDSRTPSRDDDFIGIIMRVRQRYDTTIYDTTATIISNGKKQKELCGNVTTFQETKKKNSYFLNFCVSVFIQALGIWLLFISILLHVILLV